MHVWKIIYVNPLFIDFLGPLGIKDLHYTTQKLLLQHVSADHKFQQYTKIATSGTEMILARMYM